MRTGPSTRLWGVRAAQSGTIWQELAGFEVVAGVRKGSQIVDADVTKCPEMSGSVGLRMADLSVVVVASAEIEHWYE